MKTTFVSTQAINNAINKSVRSTQQLLIDAQVEVSTGRHADVGRALGYRTGQTVSLRIESSRLTAITETNGVVSTRLETAQGALTGIVATAQEFLGQLFGARDSVSGASVLQRVAQNGLSSLGDLLNSAIDGEFVFAGVNVDVKPVTDYYDDPPPASRQSIEAAFIAEFGFSQSDPQVANITSTAMQTFLDGNFAAEFDPASWSADWTTASQEPVRSRISNRELIDSSVTANEQAFRKLAKAFTMLADLGTENLNDSAFETIIDKAAGVVTEAISELSQLQGRLGSAQERIASANERMSLSQDILKKQISDFETVDPYEAVTRVNTLLTQLESSYAVTARIQGLSLLNYL